MKRCGDCNARYGTAHATNCPKYLESLYKRIAELEADKQRLWDSIEAGESVYKRKCAKLEAENRRLRSALLNSMEWNWLDDDAPERYDLDNLPEVLEDTQ